MTETDLIHAPTPGPSLDAHVTAALESDDLLLATGRLNRLAQRVALSAITTDAQCEHAVEAIRSLGAEIAGVKAHFERWRSPLYHAWRRVTTASATAVTEADEAEARLRRLVQEWRDARERDRQQAIEEERQRRVAEVHEAREREQAAAREEEAARRRERDATSKAEREAAARDADAREADRQAAARETAAVEHAPPTPPAKDAYLPPGKGISGRKTWKAKVTDMNILLRAVADDLTHDRQSPLLAAVTVDKRKLGQIARAHEGTLDYPGVRFWVEGGVTIRRDPPRS